MTVIDEDLSTEAAARAAKKTKADEEAAAAKKAADEAHEKKIRELARAEAKAVIDEEIEPAAPEGGKK